MTQILGAKFNFLTVFGLAVICAAALFGVWKVIDFYLPDKTTENLITVEQIRSINNERYNYEDSAKKVSDSQFYRVIFDYVNESAKSQNNLRNFDLNSKQKTDEKTNHVNGTNDSELLRLWSDKYR